MEGWLNTQCSSCETGSGDWRCLDCIGRPVICRICCRALHAKFPFHRVEVWTGTHFQASLLIHVGLFIQLGHGGSTCPYPRQGTTHMSSEEDDWEDDLDDDPSPNDEEDDFRLSDKSLKPKDTCPNSNDIAAGQVITIVDISGVHRMVIRTCCCVSNRDADDIQLLRMGFMAASYSRIRTAFTFRVLDDFRLSNLECHTSAYQYFKKLRRMTSPAFPHLVLVSMGHNILSILFNQL